MKSFKPHSIGLLQAVALTAYIGLFASVVNFLESSGLEPKVAPGVGVMIFLLVFVFSALISSTIMLGYPLNQFFAGKRREAFAIVGWSAAWLLVIGIIIAAILFTQ